MIHKKIQPHLFTTELWQSEQDLKNLSNIIASVLQVDMNDLLILLVTN
jgi:hypothetical protein